MQLRILSHERHGLYLHPSPQWGDRSWRLMIIPQNYHPYIDRRYIPRSLPTVVYLRSLYESLQGHTIVRIHWIRLIRPGEPSFLRSQPGLASSRPRHLPCLSYLIPQIRTELSRKLLCVAWSHSNEPLHRRVDKAFKNLWVLVVCGMNDSFYLEFVNKASLVVVWFWHKVVIVLSNVWRNLSHNRIFRHTIRFLRKLPYWSWFWSWIKNQWRVVFWKKLRLTRISNFNR